MLAARSLNREKAKKDIKKGRQQEDQNRGPQTKERSQRRRARVPEIKMKEP